MKRALLIDCLVALAGCNNQGMTNEEIVAAYKLCRQNGMDVELKTVGIDGLGYRAYCVPVEYTPRERLEILARRFPVQKEGEAGK